MTRTLVTLALFALASPASADLGTLAGPVRVIDGDTIVLTDTNTHIRLNGVDAPEVVHPGYDHDDPFGPEASRRDAADRRRHPRPPRHLPSSRNQRSI
jgi:endonuclease YncB( thermonuclease family)